MAITPLKDFQSKASNNTKLALVAGAVFIILLVVSYIYTEDPKSLPKKDSKVEITQSSATNGLNPEAVAARNEQLKTQIEEQRRQLEELKKKQDLTTGEGSTSNNSEMKVVLGQIKELQDQLNWLKSSKSPAVDQAPALSTPVDSHTTERPATPEAPKLRVIKKDPATQVAEQQSAKTPAAYLPAGANYEAILLNGMNARTDSHATSNPTPALLRVKTDAILPNFFSHNIKECFVLVGGVGSMSSESVDMRTDVMSCISEDGKVFEGKIQGYVVGENGRVGVTGRLVSKQGSILAKSLLAGFASGLGNAFSPVANQSFNINPTQGGQQGFQYPSPDYVLGSGVGKGLQTAGTQLSQFYIQMAKDMFPVVEVDAGRKVTIILVKGVELK